MELLSCDAPSQTSVASISNAKENPKDHKDHKDHQAAAPANTECVILLADQYLMQLPLEALQLLQMDHVSSVSREISLQMMFNKMHSGSSAGKYKHVQVNKTFAGKYKYLQLNANMST